MCGCMGGWVDVVWVLLVNVCDCVGMCKCEAEAVGREETYKVRVWVDVGVCVLLCGCMGGLHLYM